MCVKNYSVCGCSDWHMYVKWEEYSTRFMGLSVCNTAKEKKVAHCEEYKWTTFTEEDPARIAENMRRPCIDCWKKATQGWPGKLHKKRLEKAEEKQREQVEEFWEGQGRRRTNLGMPAPARQEELEKRNAPIRRQPSAPGESSSQGVDRRHVGPQFDIDMEEGEMREEGHRSQAGYLSQTRHSSQAKHSSQTRHSSQAKHSSQARHSSQAGHSSQIGRPSQTGQSSQARHSSQIGRPSQKRHLSQTDLAQQTENARRLEHAKENERRRPIPDANQRVNSENDRTKEQREREHITEMSATMKAKAKEFRASLSGTTPRRYDEDEDEDERIRSQLEGEQKAEEAREEARQILARLRERLESR